MPAALFVALAPNPVPFMGGTPVAVPALLQLVLVTDGTGSLGRLVPGSDTPVWVVLQFALADAGQPAGVALSYAVELQFGP